MMMMLVGGKRASVLSKRQFVQCYPSLKKKKKKKTTPARHVGYAELAVKRRWVGAKMEAQPRFRTSQRGAKRIKHCHIQLLERAARRQS